MSSTLHTSYVLSTDHYLLTASLDDGGTLPKEIFIFTNTGTGVLGEFFGTCNVSELGKLAIFTPGVPQPVFGNRYLRHSEAKIIVPLDVNPQTVFDALIKNVKSLSLAYSNLSPTTASYNIP